mgnify:CR=1 FL=1
MNQAELVRKLDDYFAVKVFDEREQWQQKIPAADLAGYRRYAVPEFLEGSWNGLMLDNALEVDRVYLVVFPGQAVLDTILALELEREAPGALIFAHHPADFEESDRGFLGISEAQIEDLLEHDISFYSCHQPLDYHPETSTVMALAKAIKLRDSEVFVNESGHPEGAHGRVADMSFGSFAALLAEVTELPRLPYQQVRFNGQPVEHVALIPGGGCEPDQLLRARDLGCDTYLTGHWWLEGDYAYADEHRARMRELVPTLPMNLLGTSHYASEMVVMRDQMPGWFRNAGIEARFIKQPDPWS